MICTKIIIFVLPIEKLCILQVVFDKLCHIFKISKNNFKVCLFCYFLFVLCQYDEEF